MQVGNFGFGDSGSGGGGTPIVGGGTLNYISKFTPNGTTIANSLLYDNGTSVGVGTNTPDASALLDLSSTSQGFATPRMTTLQRNAIVAPTIGLLIYNTSSSFFNYWDGVAWIQMDTSTGGDVSGSGTTNYAVKWTDGTNSVIGDGTWYFSTNDYLPVTTGSNIGDATHRIGTIFMASVFDYANNLTFFNGTSTTATLTTTGNFGIGISPTYKLDILSSSLNTLRVHADAVTNNAVISSSNQSTFLTLDTAITSVLGSVGSNILLRTAGVSYGSFFTNSSNTNTTLKSDNGYWLNLTNSTTESIGLGQGGNFMQFNMNGVNNMILVGSTGNFGVGTNSNPTARIYALGVDNTLANYAFKADDSLGNPLLYVRNDSKVSVNTNTFYNARLNVYNISATYTDLIFQAISDIPFVVNGLNAFSVNTAGRIVSNIPDSALAPTLGHYLAAPIGSTRALSVTTNAGSQGLLEINIDGSFAIGHLATITTQFVHDGLSKFTFTGDISQSVGINIANPTATTHIQGRDNTLANYSLKVDNSLGNPLLYVRNDGVSTFNTSVTYATNFGYDVKWQSFSNPSSSNGNYISLCTGGGSIFQTAFSRRNGGVVKSEMYFIESNDTTYMAIGVIGDANKALALRTNDLDRLFINHSGDIGVSKNAMSARFHVFGVDAVNNINQRLEPVTNVTEDTTGNTVVTTDATANVTAQTIAIPTNKVVSLESTIVYRKTAGAGVGVIGDGTLIKLNSSVTDKGGVLTLDIVQNTYSGITNAIAGVSANYIVSGINILVAVTGVLNDDITWNVITKINTVA